MVVYGALARHREADSAALTLPLFARSLIYGMQTIPHGHLKRAIEDALLLRDARRAAPVFTFFNNRLSASPWVDRRASRRILGELLVRGLAAGGRLCGRPPRVKGVFCVDALRGSRAFLLRTVMPVAGLCPACSRGQWPLALMDCPPPEAPIWISRLMRIPSQRVCLGSRSD